MNADLIEKSGTGIEKSGTGIETFRVGLKLMGAVRAVLMVFLVWGSTAVAVQGDGTGTSSHGDAALSLGLAVNDDLVTVSFRDGFKVVSGYGYTEKGYTEVSLYSLEYVHVSNSGAVQSEIAPVQGDGTGSKSTGESGGQLKPWGIAEVVFNGNQADIILYQFNEEGVLQEAGVYADVGIQ